MLKILELMQLVAKDIRRYLPDDAGEGLDDLRRLSRELVERGGIDMERVTPEDIEHYIQGEACDIKELAWGLQEISWDWRAREEVHPGWHRDHPQDIVGCALCTLILVKLIDDGLLDWEMRLNSIWWNCHLIFEFVEPSTMVRLYAAIFRRRKFDEFIRDNWGQK